MEICHVMLFLQICLKRVALLDDASRRHFHIGTVTVGPRRQQRGQKVEDGCQEWTNDAYSPGRSSNEKVYRVKVRPSVTLMLTMSHRGVCVCVCVRVHVQYNGVRVCGSGPHQDCVCVCVCVCVWVGR